MCEDNGVQHVLARGNDRRITHISPHKKSYYTVLNIFGKYKMRAKNRADSDLQIRAAGYNFIMNCSVFRSLQDLFFPRTCFSCGSRITEGILCPLCLRQIRFIRPPVCRMCSGALGDGTAVCRRCLRSRPAYHRLICAAHDTEPLSGLIRLLKYRHYDFIGEFLSRLLVRYCREQAVSFPPETVAVGVPLHPARRRERGYNQTALLAKNFSKFIHISFRDDIIVRLRNRPSQTHLSIAQRRKNVQNSFIASKRAKGKTILLVDDIYTTGATVNACSRVLREAGAGDITVLTVARACPEHTYGGKD
ncbi:MAG: hypothetical protein GF333_04495 [Candidatus Omnitrophica bacterium]|nr:hypothetical protein [Candidatus Omnitrophota bacterium]